MIALWEFIPSKVVKSPGELGFACNVNNAIVPAQRSQRTVRFYPQDKIAGGGHIEYGLGDKGSEEQFAVGGYASIAHPTMFCKQTVRPH